MIRLNYEIQCQKLQRVHPYFMAEMKEKVQAGQKLQGGSLIAIWWRPGFTEGLSLPSEVGLQTQHSGMPCPNLSHHRVLLVPSLVKRMDNPLGPTEGGQGLTEMFVISWPDSLRTISFSRQWHRNTQHHNHLDWFARLSAPEQAPPPHQWFWSCPQSTPFQRNGVIGSNKWLFLSKSLYENLY